MTWINARSFKKCGLPIMKRVWTTFLAASILIPAILLAASVVCRAQNISDLPDQRVCRDALDPSQSVWDKDRKYLKYVEEATRRAFTVDSCRELLRRAPTNQPTVANRNLPTVGNLDQKATIAAPDISDLPDLGVCAHALDASWSAWDKDRTYSKYIEEATGRGFTVDSCRQMLQARLLQPPNHTASAETPSMEEIIHNLQNSREAMVKAVALMVGVRDVCRNQAMTNLEIEKKPTDPEIGKKAADFAMAFGYRVDDAFVRDVKDNALNQLEILANDPESRQAFCACAHIIHVLIVQAYDLQEKKRSGGTAR